MVCECVGIIEAVSRAPNTRHYFQYERGPLPQNNLNLATDRYCNVGGVIRRAEKGKGNCGAIKLYLEDNLPHIFIFSLRRIETN